jgi:hypothetical protein
MRHVRSFMLSLVLAPLIWALTGLGLAVHAGVGPNLAADPARHLGLGALAAAGALVAILVVVRLSPVGPTLAGLGFLGAVAYAPTLRPLVPALPNDLDAAVVLPADGFAVVLGIPLLATLLSGHRWRRAESTPVRYADPATQPAGGPPAPTLVSPAPTLVSPPVPPEGSSPAPTYGSPPAPAFGSPPAPTFGSPPAPAYGSPPASAYGRPPVAPTFGPPPDRAHGSQPAPTLIAPIDPWHGWTVSEAADGLPGYAAHPDQGGVNPWARPSGSSPEDATDDLSAALLPLRAPTPPRAR